MRGAAPFAPREDLPGDSLVVRVFVSSTWYDLEPERQAVETALARLAETKFIGMEHFGSREEGSLDVSLDEVDKADLYVGILAGRYGSGITDAEYQRARRRGLDCLIYHKKEPTWIDDDPGQRESLERFRKETERHKHSTFTTPDDLAARVTADLHRWLVDNVLVPRLRKAGFTDALADAYLPPWPVFERLDLDRFTGRLWLTAEVDRFLEAHDRGYFILEADAGLGKSAFLAHLVRERRWIHHFVELARGQDGIRHGVRNLAAQIALTWEPEHAGSLEDVSRSDLLQNLLRAAAERRDQISPGAKIVLVVDGLDESAALPDQNVMGLPRVLPAGVYCVVSQRPVQVILETEAPRQLVPLQSGETRNLEDMRAFLVRVAQSERVAAVLTESSVSADDFVSTLLERSQGVWIYLHYILEELERGERRPLDLKTLPRGLWEYYAGRWRRRRDGPHWASVELPLLAVLAAAQEELPARLLCAFAGLAETPQVTRLLREDFRPFLATSATDERRYRCYHASFREFLEGRADRSRLTAAEEALADELAAATRAAHSRIADRALEAWGGLENGLPRLNDPARRDLDGGYALRHVVAHLEGAGLLADLSRLLRTESVQGDRSENVWFAVHERTKDLAGYLSDVVRVWRAADAAAQAAIDRGEQPALAIALQARCVLLLASVSSLAERLGPSLLAALVEKEIWEPKHAFTHALQHPDASARFLAMARLVPVLPEPLRSEALQEAIATARWCQPEHLAALPSDLPHEILEALVHQQLARDRRGDGALVALAPKLPEKLLAEVVGAVRAKPVEREELLLGLLPFVSPMAQEDLAQRVRQSADHTSWEPRRLELLLRIAEFLPTDQKKDVVREALRLARTDPFGYKAHLLVYATLALHGKEQEVVARKALKAALRGHIHEVLRDLLPHLPRNLLSTAERQILWNRYPSWGWERHIPFFAARWESHSRKMEGALARIEKHYFRGEALAALAPFLPDLLIERALRSALAIGFLRDRSLALDGLASRLSRPQLERALASLLEADELSRLYLGRESLRDLIDRLSSPERARGPALRNSRGRARLRTHELEDLSSAIAAARQLRFPASKAEELLRIAAEAPGTRQELVAEASRAIRSIPHDPHGKTELLLIAALLSGEPARQGLLARVVGRARSLVAEWNLREAAYDLLGAVAPHLSEPLLREALSCAEKIENAGALRKILLKLIPRLPEKQAAEPLLLAPGKWSLLAHDAPARGGDVLLSRPGSWLEGLASWVLNHVPPARHLFPPSFRLKVLATQLPNWTGSTKGQVAGRALLTALTIPDPLERADAFDLLSVHLHPCFQRRLRRAAQALRSSAPAVQPTEATALETLRETASPAEILDLLQNLAEEERKPLLARALEIAESLENPALRAWTLLQLVPYLPAEEAEDLLRQWLHYAHVVDVVPHLVEGWGRCRSPFAETVARALLETRPYVGFLEEVLIASAPHLPDAVLGEALEKVWLLDLGKRRPALRALAARLLSLPASSLYPLWRGAMQSAAGGSRDSAIADVEALLPVLEHLGGRRALDNVFGLSDLE